MLIILFESHQTGHKPFAKAQKTVYSELGFFQFCWKRPHIIKILILAFPIYKTQNLFECVFSCNKEKRECQFAVEQENQANLVEMATYLWRKYADYVYTKWERTILWDMIDPYRRPKSFKPLVTIYIAAFYTGVIGSAITEQLHKVNHSPLETLCQVPFFIVQLCHIYLIC